MSQGFLIFASIKLIAAAILTGMLSAAGIIYFWNPGKFVAAFTIFLCVEFFFYKAIIHALDLIDARRASNNQKSRKRKLNFSPELNARIEKHLNDLEGRN